MYRLLRDLHLFLGLLASIFMITYALGAFRMGHYFLFRWSSPTTQTSVVRLVEDETDPRALVGRIREAADLRGDLFDVETSSTGLTFDVRRPGTTHRVVLDVRTNTASVATTSGGFWEMIDKMHHTGGTWHDEPIMSAWGVVVGVASVVLAFIALTGLFLWFKRHKERRLGGLLLLASMVFSLGLLFLVRG